MIKHSVKHAYEIYGQFCIWKARLVNTLRLK